MFLLDSFRNFVAGLATQSDKATGSEYFFMPMSTDQLVNAYRGSWLPRKIIRVPANDATRKWRSWNAEKDQITKIEQVERDLAVQKKVHDALILARLFGGSCIYIGTKDRDLSFPIQENATITSLTVLSRYRVTPVKWDVDLTSPGFGQPELFRVTLPGVGDFNQEVHASRLCMFQGAQLEDRDLMVGDGYWSDSILDSVIQALHQSDATIAAMASMVFEAKIDVIRIPNMMKNIGDKQYEARLQNRVMLSGLVKGINSALLMDKEEEFEQKQLNFGSIPDLMDRFMQNVSGAADIPMTRLWGRSPAGMNSTGEGDMRNYYDSVSDLQSNEITPAISKLDDLILAQALGDRPEELFYDWRSLWQSTEVEKAEIFTKLTDGISKLASTKLIMSETLATAATNMLIESGTMPGLEGAIEEFGLEPEEEELMSNEELLTAALGTTTQNPPGQEDQPDVAEVADAAARTLYVRRDVLNKGAITAWAKSQGFKEVVDDLHVTIVHSRTPLDWMKVGSSWEDTMVLPAGGPRIMETFGESKVLLFSAQQLQWRHREAIEQGASHDFPEYQPHITISKESIDLSKVQAYTGPIMLGPEIFEEVKE